MGVDSATAEDYGIAEDPSCRQVPDGNNEGGGHTAEMSLYRVEQELKDRTTLLSAGGDHRPDARTTGVLFAPRPLRDVPVNRNAFRPQDFWNILGGGGT